MLSSSALPVINGGVLLPALQLSSPGFHAFAGFKLQVEQDLRLFRRRTKSREIRILANPNTDGGLDGDVAHKIKSGWLKWKSVTDRASSYDKARSKKEVVMVEPLEAKRLAAKEMEQIQAKENLKGCEKRRKTEAISVTLAMIGLTAGLLIDGHTGNTILAQLAGYWAVFLGFFMR
ncbi:hypothetical protein OROGR_013750 [Orobanche gracilis]